MITPFEIIEDLHGTPESADLVLYTYRDMVNAIEVAIDETLQELYDDGFIDDRMAYHSTSRHILKP